MKTPPHALTNLGVLVGGWIFARVAIHAMGWPTPALWQETAWQIHGRASAPAQPPRFIEDAGAANVPASVILAIERHPRPRNAVPPLHPKVSARADHPAQRSLGGREPALPNNPEARKAQLISFPSQLQRAGPNDWSLSAWVLYRGDGGTPGIAPNGQLGGSQAGLRVKRRVWAPDSRTAVSLNARFSSSLSDREEREAAIGLSVSRLGKIPLELLVERRVATGRKGRNAFALIGISGVDDVPLPASFRLSGYAQAGAVGIKSKDLFFDGAVRAERPVMAIGGSTLDLGLGVWGAAQRGVARLDAGPSASFRFRAGGAAIRLAAEWRQRVAGNAAPGSGPAVTLGLDY